MADEASQQANRSGIDPKRLVVIFYLAFGIVLILFLDHVLKMLWGNFGWKDPELIEGVSLTNVTSFVSFALTIGAAIGAWMHPVTRTLSMEVAQELMKVTWPSWAETRVSTIAVVIASLIAAVILFFIDTVSYKLMVDWLPQIWEKL